MDEQRHGNLRESHFHPNLVGTASIYMESGTTTFSGPVTFAAGPNTPTLWLTDFNGSGGPWRLNRHISGTGNIITNGTHGGGSNIVFSGSNTYQGSTEIAEGDVAAGSTQPFGANAIMISSITSPELPWTSTATVWRLALSPGGGTTGGNVVLSGGQTLTVGSLNTNTTYAGLISDNGSGGGLTKVGSGTLNLK